MEDALQQKRQVSFKYFDLDENAHKVFRRDGLLYVMEPISLVFNEDNYRPLWMSVIYGIKLGGSGGSDDIVAVALSQIGNVGVEPYWSWYGFNSRVEWCACFVSWCANECGYIESGAVPLYAYCPFGVDWFKSHGQWMDGSEAPEPGMIIFFDWDDRGSSGKQDGSADHTGIVERVEDGIVYTVEGNSYQFTVSVGFDGDGKQVRHYMTYTPPANISETKRDKLVQEAYNEFRNKAEGNRAFNENMKFKDLAEMYFKEYAPYHIRELTQYNYESNVRQRINPVFANTRLKDMDTAKITKFLLSLDMAPQTARKTKTVLQSIFNYAVEQKIVKENPCKETYVKKKAEDTDGLAIDKTKYLSIADAQKLMELTSEYSNFNTMIQLLLHTGMRSGELLGLKWECINFEAKTICIKYTKCNTDHSYLSPPKTAKSRRTICIDDDMIQMLKRHKQEQDKLKKAFGDAWEQPEMVFTTGTGKWFDRNELNKRLKRLMKQNGLPEISAHKLRHTYSVWTSWVWKNIRSRKVG